LIIVHAGILYGGRRDVVQLAEALAAVMSDGSVPRGGIVVRLVGPPEPATAGAIAKLGLEDVIQQVGPLRREDALDEQRRAHVLLLLTWEHEPFGASCPAKLFEYLGMRRPVLHLGSPSGEAARLLEETGAGVTYSTNNVDGLRGYLTRAYAAQVSSTATPSERNESAVARYSQVTMANRLSEILDAAVGVSSADESSSCERPGLERTGTAGLTSLERR
jgi:glycosyltransferase involved in cell wall biosynthesis